MVTNLRFLRPPNSYTTLSSAKSLFTPSLSPNLFMSMLNPLSSPKASSNGISIFFCKRFLDLAFYLEKNSKN